MIVVEGLSKAFNVPQRAAGLAAAVRSLFRREYTRVEALWRLCVCRDIYPGSNIVFLDYPGTGNSEHFYRRRQGNGAIPIEYLP